MTADINLDANDATTVPAEPDQSLLTLKEILNTQL
jgi:hypothetical protein